MRILLAVIISLITGFFFGRHTRFRSKNYGVTRKMFLTLERSEIDRKIDIALDLEDYESAMILHRKLHKLDKKINRIKRKEERKNARYKINGRNKKK